MAREIGYYWVRHKNSQAEWAVGNWDGLHFFLSSNGPIHANFLEIDERRIVRDDSKRAEGRREKFKRNLHITAVVLGGDRMKDVAKLHGLSSNRVRQIVHNTLREKNKALYNKLVSLRAGHGAPLLCDLQLCAAEFGFPLQAEVGDGQK
jgi:hypothetical protein